MCASEYSVWIAISFVLSSPDLHNARGVGLFWWISVFVCALKMSNSQRTAIKSLSSNRKAEIWQVAVVLDIQLDILSCTMTHIHKHIHARYLHPCHPHLHTSTCKVSPLEEGEAVSGTNDVHSHVYFPLSLWPANLPSSVTDSWDWNLHQLPPCLSVIIYILLCLLFSYTSTSNYPSFSLSPNCHSTPLHSGDTKGPADAPIDCNKLYVVS